MSLIPTFMLFKKKFSFFHKVFQKITNFSFYQEFQSVIDEEMDIESDLDEDDLDSDTDEEISNADESDNENMAQFDEDSDIENSIDLKC